MLTKKGIPWTTQVEVPDKLTRDKQIKCLGYVLDFSRNTTKEQSEEWDKNDQKAASAWYKKW